MKVTEEDILKVTAKKMGLEIVDLTNIQIDPKVKECISEKVAKHYHVLPIAVEAGLITLAIADPFNVQLTDDLKILLGTDLKIVIAKEKQIEHAIKETYSIT